MAGGTYGFGVNLWLDGAAPGSPRVSAFAANGDAGTFMADGTAGCTPDFNGRCTAGSNALSWLRGTHTVTLTSFSISQIGGATAGGTSCVDKVGYANSTVIQNMPNGICDTVGNFTLTVQ